MNVSLKYLLLFLSFLWIHASGISNPDSITISDTLIRTDSLSQNLTIPLASDTLAVDTVLPPIDLQDDSLNLKLSDTLTGIDTAGFQEIIKPDTFSLVMVGDVMLGTNYPSSSYLPPGNNCYPLLNSVKNFIQDADISFCNLEGVFAGESGTPKSCKNPENCYVFRMPDEYAGCLVDAGFDLLSVANNHVNDFGIAGRVNTIQVLENAGLHFAGFVDRPYTIFVHEGLTVGFCAFSPNSGVMDIRNLSDAESIVRMLSDTCDIVIVSMHGGAEGRDHQHVTRNTEIFLNANRGNVYEFAHRMIDAGADIIIGHGPHVTRAMEIYNDRLIAYSLGNFATYSRFNISGPNGIAPLIKIWIDSDGKFLGGKITPIMQVGEGGAVPDPDRRVIYKIQDLIRMDFPNNMLIIDDEGNITP